ncbi:MAG TPA: hypothetical protein P5116_06840, partial [Eubacteriales bacterium]|nr:hypothetical protein [Eubacteriales bacterium]
LGGGRSIRLSYGNTVLGFGINLGCGRAIRNLTRFMGSKSFSGFEAPCRDTHYIKAQGFVNADFHLSV